MLRYIVTDTETTGLDPSVDRIVEIATVWFEGEEDKQVSLHSLCNPNRDIPPEVMAVHHITNEMVAKCQPYDVIVEEVLGWAHPLYIVAHNAEFDQGFIKPLIDSNPKWICTYRCAMHLWPDAPGHSNQTLRYWLKLQLDNVLPTDLYPHRALYDTIVTAHMFKKMLETHTLEQLYELTNTPILLKTCKFPKYRGVLWKDVPHNYLQWILRNPDMDKDVRYTAKYYLTPQTKLI